MPRHPLQFQKFFRASEFRPYRHPPGPNKDTPISPANSPRGKKKPTTSPELASFHPKRRTFRLPRDRSFRLPGSICRRPALAHRGLLRCSPRFAPSTLPASLAAACLSAAPSPRLSDRQAVRASATLPARPALQHSNRPAAVPPLPSSSLRQANKMELAN